MKKVSMKPRENWVNRCLERNFTYHSVDGKYWIEDYAIEFSYQEIEKIKQAASEIHSMCFDMASDTIKSGDYEKYKIPSYICSEIEKSWHANDFSIYGRFDFSFDGNGYPKVLEYNADTAQSIVESSVVQSDWLYDHVELSDAQQLNDIDQLLFETFKKWPKGKKLFFSATNLSSEEYLNCMYLKNAAQEAGVDCEFVFLKDVCFDEKNSKFFCYKNTFNHEPTYHDIIPENYEVIENLFKLYPWEYMVHEEIFFKIKKSSIKMIEPAWKMLFATKSILPLLWEKHKNHPNLLEAHFDNTEFIQKRKNFVKKPIYSREGMNTVVYEFQKDELIEKDSQKGHFGSEGFIYQERKDCAQFDNRYNMIGVWMIDQKPAGIGIRDDSTIITKDTCLFVPHYIKD